MNNKYNNKMKIWKNTKNKIGYLNKKLNNFLMKMSNLNKKLIKMKDLKLKIINRKITKQRLLKNTKIL